MKAIRIYALLALMMIFAFPSCAIIEINGLGNDYNDLTENQKTLPCSRYMCVISPTN